MLKGARMLPITTLIRLTFYRCVKIFHYSNEIFEVTTTLHGFYMDKGNNIQIVKLKETTCTCNKWQSFGIPCSHVLTICACARMDSWQFIDKHYRMDVYGCCYTPQFNPIPHQAYWPEPNF